MREKLSARHYYRRLLASCMARIIKVGGGTAGYVAVSCDDRNGIMHGCIVLLWRGRLFLWKNGVR